MSTQFINSIAIPERVEKQKEDDFLEELCHGRCLPFPCQNFSSLISLQLFENKAIQEHFSDKSTVETLPG